MKLESMTSIRDIFLAAKTFNKEHCKAENKSLYSYEFDDGQIVFFSTAFENEMRHNPNSEHISKIYSHWNMPKHIKKIDTIYKLGFSAYIMLGGITENAYYPDR